MKASSSTYLDFLKMVVSLSLGSGARLFSVAAAALQPGAPLPLSASHSQLASVPSLLAGSMHSLSHSHSRLRAHLPCLGIPARPQPARLRGALRQIRMLEDGGEGDADPPGAGEGEGDESKKKDGAKNEKQDGAENAWTPGVADLDIFKQARAKRFLERELGDPLLDPNYEGCPPDGACEPNVEGAECTYEYSSEFDNDIAATTAQYSELYADRHLLLAEGSTEIQRLACALRKREKEIHH